MPTIYTGHARSGAPMAQLDVLTDYVTFFENYKPARVAAAETKEQKDAIKQRLLIGAIAGQMKPNSPHGNDNVMGRDLIPLDFDHIDNEAAFLDSIHSKLDSRFGYVLYKTYSYRPDNVRYRLLIPLDRMVKRENEFKAIMQVLARILETDLDDASTVWGQIFFLPVVTEYNGVNFLTTNRGAPLVVNSWLSNILQLPEYQDAKEKLLERPKVAYQAPQYKQPLGFALDELAAGMATRAHYLAVVQFFTNIGMSAAEIAPWLDYFDSIQTAPPVRTKTEPNVTPMRPKKRGYWAEMFNLIINGSDEGDRNKTMFNFAAFLLDQMVLAPTLVKFTGDADDRNRPPMGTTELTRTLNSALRRKKMNDDRSSRN